MELNKVYEMLDKYNFTDLDVCSKSELITMLICYIKKISSDRFKISKADIKLNENEINDLIKYVKLVTEDKIPPQYIIGEVFFYNEKYNVTKDVLIPRQDTENVVEAAINCINKYSLKKGLDMCTGSGAIGISVINNSSIEEMTLCDISNKALEVAKSNISKNNVNKKINTLCSNLFEGLMTTNIKYDIIISNPPYIKSYDINSLSVYVKNEPLIALDGGRNGLYFYEKIIKDARSFLRNDGFLVLEIGYDQMEDLINIFNNYSEYTVVQKIKDYNMNDRGIICRFHKI